MVNVILARSTALSVAAFCLATFVLCPAAFAGGSAALDAAPIAVTPIAVTPDLGWISGRWRNEAENRISEEIWTTGEGGVYFAVNRTIVAGRTSAFEFIRIETDGGGAYIAQPGGGAPVRFALVESGAQRALFSNPDHDFPKFIEYVREGDRLTARIWGVDGPEKAMAFVWRRAGE